METTVSVGSQSQSWELVPTNFAVGGILTILSLYLFVRHIIFVFAIMDLILGWFRKFKWFPSEGKRLKAFVHWLIAVVLFVGYILVAKASGWMDFVPIARL